jgi:2-dehydropantoate 2-reductase
MHVLCYGAGSVGSLVGGRLSESGAASVTLLARRNHVAAIRTWGLVLEGPSGRTVCKGADSITSLDDLTSPPDLVILTVKAYQTSDALADLRDFLARGIPILSLQNGVGNEDLIAAAAPAARVIAGAITISVSVVRPGVVRQQTGGGGIAVAPAGGSGDSGAGDLAALFQRAGFRAETKGDYRALKWSKLLLNLIANASSAILGLPPAAIVQDPRVFHLEREAFREAVRVMRALGLRPVALPGYPVPLLARIMDGPEWLGRVVLSNRIGRGRGDKMPSLWEDLERGRARSEVEVLNGAVAREGARLGIPTPVNTLLTEVLLSLASGARDRGAFRQNPGALVSLQAGVAPA